MTLLPPHRGGGRPDEPMARIKEKCYVVSAMAGEQKKSTISPRELAYGGLFGAAGLTLPILFHLLHLGHVFMPMYLPLMALAFFASPRVCAATAFVTPLLSAVLTGMPPFYPPVVVAMSMELAVMSALASWAYRRWSGSVLFVLIPVLLLGRVFQAGSGYLLGLLIDLPPRFLSVVSVVSGWPGLVLMVLVIPPLVRLVRSKRGHAYEVTP